MSDHRFSSEKQRYQEYLERQRQEAEEREFLKHEKESRKAHLPELPVQEVVSQRKQFERKRRLLKTEETVLLLVLLSLIGYYLWAHRTQVQPYVQDEGQAQFARKWALPLEITNSIGQALRLIPSGSFQIGSPLDEWEHQDDEYQHTARIPVPFYMAATEITQAQYERVMQTNPCFFAGGPDTPAESMSWFDAVKFCNVLSRNEGFAPVYELVWGQWVFRTERNGYRLPVEAEWEYACRAGTESALNTGPIAPIDQGKKNIWRAAWYHDNSDGYPHPVAEREANRWGLYDMHGNVVEWCYDWYAPYPKAPEHQYLGADGETFKVLRGGGWFDLMEKCRSAARQIRRPKLGWKHAGIRLVRTVRPAGFSGDLPGPKLPAPAKRPVQPAVTSE